jgi:CheY-like chemotaxis protein
VDSCATSALSIRLYLDYVGIAVDHATDHGELYRLLEDRITEGEEGYGGIVVNLQMGMAAAAELLSSEDVVCCIKPQHRVLCGSLAERELALNTETLKNCLYLPKPLRLRDVQLIAEVLFKQGERPRVEKAITSPHPSTGRTVLVVEDNKINQQVAQGRIEGLGYRVILASNGQQALDRIKENTVDIVFMDCQMPVMDGFEAARRIRKMEKQGRRKLPIIAMTAHALAGDRDACLQAGMDDYIAKPFRTESLEEILKKWLDSLESR